MGAFAELWVGRSNPAAELAAAGERYLGTGCHATGKAIAHHRGHIATCKNC